MAVNTQELQRLLRNRQGYFVPLYLAIVDQHPEGILAKDVKEQVATHLLGVFGIDVFDTGQVGVNRSTQRSRADQWMNNLVSNQVLDEYMLVVRAHRATLYPGTFDNSLPGVPTGPALDPSEVEELNIRPPKKAPSVVPSSSGTYQRSLQLAEHVRSLNGYKCAVDGPRCASFTARDGHPYVEVHHIVPMAKQHEVGVNLDRVSNMVPLCARCHTCLHRGARGDADLTLHAALAWFEAQHGVSFANVNADLGIEVSLQDLLTIYGAI